MVLLLGNFIGMRLLLPTLVALATDYLYKEEMMLDWSVSTVGIPASALVIVLLWLSLRPYGRDRLERLGLEASLT